MGYILVTNNTIRLLVLRRTGECTKELETTVKLVVYGVSKRYSIYVGAIQLLYCYFLVVVFFFNVCTIIFPVAVNLSLEQGCALLSLNRGIQMLTVIVSLELNYAVSIQD